MNAAPSSSGLDDEPPIRNGCGGIEPQANDVLEASNGKRRARTIVENPALVFSIGLLTFRATTCCG